MKDLLIHSHCRNKSIRSSMQRQTHIHMNVSDPVRIERSAIPSHFVYSGSINLIPNDTISIIIENFVEKINLSI
jgi:hypothetical protein